MYPNDPEELRILVEKINDAMKENTRKIHQKIWDRNEPVLFSDEDENGNIILYNVFSDGREEIFKNGS